MVDNESASTDRSVSPVVVLDLASLRFRWSVDDGRIQVLTAAGELLACTDTPEGCDDRSAALAGLEEAIGSARLLYMDEPCPVGFYNPHTAEVALGSRESSTVFSADTPITLDVSGEPAFVDIPDAVMRMANGVVLRAAERTPGRVLRAVAAHRS